jgi:hypothetical protein
VLAQASELAVFDRHYPVEECRREDSAGVVLSSDMVSIKCCHVWLFEELSCCRVQEKSPLGGAFVSYLLAVNYLERAAGTKHSCFFKRLPVQPQLTHNPSDGPELQVLRPPIGNCGCLSCC